MARVIECRSDLDYKGAIGNAGDSLLLVEYCAHWTPPSQVISKEIGLIRLSYPNLIHLIVDFDVCPEVFQKYEVGILPTVKLIKSGVEVADIKGASIHRLKQLIEEFY